ncbi:MAG: hypothetical protein E6614_13095 [Bradyrhizobium sp.]|jgi:hypothetical protein|uniref:Uncharacterized protein n=1 Tax=Bradyrhizobium denitrificans TaxID=2734912 RepID=A0ABS5G2Z8_9BRAD|nr:MULTISPECIES: hypothetical protein [Bradyrhizobium]RTM03951.1 MAG: hypothetical protein EKK32_07195 [Bradyrhizobiaceae bacterium]ABQ34353.1 hypothetical protein BBta_2169 [Bradyrhizobium sp. BTAi1]MBR1135644.1 hypothetical protein [Bradyrhizobium denitrificans]MCL8482648.1 hypothetical protein [Bradyrhizobium denitrificans]MDU0956168.1 hypothetical protein [Bradyrhizobium sp.]
MTVIEHDFGMQQRQIERRFRTLLSLDALHEANVRANPVPYLERASERIYQLEKALFEAWQAAMAATDGDDETVSIGKAEHARLLQCRTIVARAYAQLVADQPAPETHEPNGDQHGE